MKKIMHVAESFATGVLSFLADLTRWQVEEYEVYVLHGVRPLTPADVGGLFDKRVRLIRVGSFRGAMGTVLNAGAYRDVRRWYGEISPDIVHFHSSAAGFVGRWALPCGKLPAFYTPHGYSFLMRGGPAVKRHLFRLMEYLSARRPATTVACGRGEYEEALRLSARSTYVDNGVDTGELRPFVRPAGRIRRPARISVVPCLLGALCFKFIFS